MTCTRVYFLSKGYENCGNSFSGSPGDAWRVLPFSPWRPAPSPVVLHPKQTPSRALVCFVNNNAAGQAALHRIHLKCYLLQYPILYCTIRYFTILYYAILQYAILYYTMASSPLQETPQKHGPVIRSMAEDSVGGPRMPSRHTTMRGP